MRGGWRRCAKAALLGVALCLAATGCAPADQQSSAQPTSAAAPGEVATGTGFDFFVLSLSWSPSYCEAEGADANRQQCGRSRPYAFVVHGLWPQYEQGYPENCRVRERDVPERQVRSLSDIMPSAGLIRHQWRKHGSCAGLAQGDYFDTLRAARERISIPAQYRRLDSYLTVTPQEVERAFRHANPGLPADGVAVSCDRRYLREVRICMTKELQFRPCAEVDRRGCRRSRMVMPPIRGG